MGTPRPDDRRVPTPASDRDVKALRSELVQNSHEVRDLGRRVDRIELTLANLAREDDASEDRPEAAMDPNH